MTTEDLYELIGVDKNASQDEIKKAYRKKAKENHPDVGGDAELFKKISYANEILSDPEKRKLYDQFGHDMGKSNNAQQTDIFDFIKKTQEQFFGNFNQYQNTIPQIRINISLTLIEMYNGISKTFKYNTNKICMHCAGLKYVPSEGGSSEKCQTCGGTGIRMSTQGHISFGTTCESCGGAGHIIKNGCKHCNATGLEKIEQTISVDIPKGIFNGAYINFPNKGNEAIINGKPIHGDLIIVAHQINDSKFLRNGNDLYFDLETPIIKCITGDEVTFETINKKNIKFKLNIGTDQDYKYKFSGMGMPIINTNNFGDLYVNIKHKMPKKLTEKELGLLNKLKTLE